MPIDLNKVSTSLQPWLGGKEVTGYTCGACGQEVDDEDSQTHAYWCD